MSQAAETPPASPDSPPSISADRALGHMFSEFPVDPEAIRTFYEALPHPSKPSLGDLLIHFSAAAVSKGDVNGTEQALFGQMFWGGTIDADPQLTPELPETTSPTIVIFAGSAVRSKVIVSDANNISGMPEQLSIDLTHELTHYAQGLGRYYKRPVLAQRLARNSVQLRRDVTHGLVNDRTWLMAGSACFIASEALTDNSLGASSIIALGGAALSHLLGVRRRRNDRKRRMARAYEENRFELDAISHQTGIPDMIPAKPEEADRDLLNMLLVPGEKHMRTARYITNRRHRKLALQPPVRYR